MEEIDFEKFFYNLSLSWFYTEPVLFQVYMTHILEKCIEMDCGIRSGQGKIQYNPEFLKNYSQKQIKDELRYELYRIMLRHPYRKKPYKADEELWFKASEITIKQTFLSTYGFDKNQSIEFYYEKLSGMGKEVKSEDGDTKTVDVIVSGCPDECLKKEEAEGDSKKVKENESPASDIKQNKTEKKSENIKIESKRDNKESNSENENNSLGQKENKKADESSLKNAKGSDKNNSQAEDKKELKQNKTKLSEGENENSSASGNKSSIPQTELWGEDDLLSESKLEIVLSKAGGKWGSVPEAIRQEIEKLQIKPVPKFIQILKSFRASVSFNQRCLTRMKPSRRSGFLRMGSKYSLLPRILIAVDVSGSILDEHMQNFFGAINQIFKTEIKGIDVVQFDAAVEGKAEKLKKVPARIMRLAKGGTNFQCVFDYAIKHNFYDGLVIFTDGGAAEPVIPENLHASVLWMTFAHAQEKEWMKKSGKVSWIYEDNEVNWVPFDFKEI